MNLQGIVVTLFTGCITMINCSAIAQGGFEQHYNGPTTIVQPPRSQQPETGKTDGFDQHFNGPTTIVKPVGKALPATTASESLPVNAAPDLVLIEEFVKRGLVQRIRDGSLSLTGSSAFLELKCNLGKKPLACGKPSNKKKNQKKH